jgi:hypothetical protein
MAIRNKFGASLGFIAAQCMRLFGGPPAQCGETQKKLNFSTSTQRMGLRFTDKLRDRFRSIWLKKR